MCPTSTTPCTVPNCRSPSSLTHSGSRFSASSHASDASRFDLSNNSDATADRTERRAAICTAVPLYEEAFNAAFEERKATPEALEGLEWVPILSTWRQQRRAQRTSAVAAPLTCTTFERCVKRRTYSTAYDWAKVTRCETARSSFPSRSSAPLR